MDSISPAKYVDADTSIKAMNWSQLEDPLDKDVWDRLTSNFWLPEKVPVSNDQGSWNHGLDAKHRDITMKVFTGLTMLDTIQGTVGALAMVQDAVTAAEEAVMTNIGFMESVHAKSYSNIFITLSSVKEIESAFRWSEDNIYIQNKAKIILEHYKGGESHDPLKCKIASTLLESFLFYSGFFWPFYLSANGELTNTADMIRLILRDEAIHGYYIGYKYQLGVSKLEPEKQKEYEEFTYKLLKELFDNEVLYAESLYSEIGITNKVIRFMKYNANKALDNLGYERLFGEEESRVDSEILAALAPQGDENQDFFSSVGSSYVMPEVEPTREEDWDDEDDW